MTIRLSALIALATALTACPAPQVDEAACAEICAGQADDGAAEAADDGAAEAVGVTLTAYEQQVLGDALADIRAGVRPLDDQSLGVCVKGENVRRCDEMLGLTPGELPEGEYILFSSFQVPSVGDKGTWKVRLEVDCTTRRTLPDGTTTESSSEWSKEYDVVHAGKDREGNPRGYTLSPLRRITSPNPNGAQDCTFKVVAPHGDGDKVYEGSWSVPGPPAE